jgi:hypothetical protein
MLCAALSAGRASGQDASAADATPAPAAAARAAEAPACVFERYISVGADAGFDAHLADEVRKDLAAELSPRGFGVCPSRAAQGELVAEVTLVQREPASIAIQVEDYTTGKRVARDVRLGRIPAGGVALAIAIATDELLRASWAELMLRREQAEREANEAEPAAETSSAGRAPESRHFVPDHKRMGEVPAALMLVFDYAHASRSWNSLGLDVRLSLRPLRYGLFEIGGGGAWALPVKSQFGTVRAAGVVALLSLGGCGEAAMSVMVCGAARGLFQWTQFAGDPAPGVEASRGSLTSFVVAGVAQAQWRFSARALLLGELSLGGAVVSAGAKDATRTLLGIDGLTVGAAVGVGYAP